MAKLSKAKIKAKARMARNLRNLFGTYPFDYTTQGIDNQREE